MERILVTGAANIGKAGVATIVYKWGQQFDSNKIIYDYLMQSGLPEKKYQDDIRDKGGIIYTLNEKKQNMLDIIKWVQKIIENHDYKVLHINSDSAYIAAAYIFAAKKAGIERIYVHSHCTQIDETNKLKRCIKTLLHKILVPYVCKNSKMYLACSKLAGYWMFGKKNVESDRYQTIYNGVEVEKYLYNEDIRNQYRREMDIEDKFVIGCVGRFSYQKNQQFLLEIFSEFLKNNRDGILLLAGDGPLRDELEKKSNELKIQDKVKFLGIRNDIPQLLSTMDVMVMPSRFEGLPVTMVEAQMASLPCVVSGNITREAQFTEQVEFIDEYHVKQWLDAIAIIKTDNRKQNKSEKLNSPFNCTIAAKKLSEILLS